jgi:hypothetical protein
MSEYATHEAGTPSGLSDLERSLLLRWAIAHIARELVISEQEAADLLDGYAERDDPARIVGDRRVVGIVVDGIEVIRTTRALLREAALGGSALN